MGNTRDNTISVFMPYVVAAITELSEFISLKSVVRLKPKLVIGPDQEQP